MKTLKSGSIFIEKIIDKFADYLDKNEKVYEIIRIKVGDPLLDYAFSRLYPYLLFSSVIFLVVFFLLVLFAIFIMKWSKN
jgi:hypothetical protein